MNPNAAIEIIELALALVKNQTGGKIQQDANLAEILVQIIGKAVQAYQDHTGETLDPSLIKAEEPV